jgi:16S rRNA processing protein RimM
MKAHGEASLVPIGRVVKPHGIKGRVKVAYFGEDLDRFLLYREVIIRDPAGRAQTFEVVEAVPQPPRIILTLKGIQTLEDTDSLINREILVPRETLPELAEDEFYWIDLLGMGVETVEGKRLGTVKTIFPTGAHDVFVVEGCRREIYLPTTADVIKRVDRERSLVTVRWMEGLWEAEDEV